MLCYVMLTISVVVLKRHFIEKKKNFQKRLYKRGAQCLQFSFFLRFSLHAKHDFHIQKSF